MKIIYTKKHYALILFFLFIEVSAFSQTWNGATSTNWNIATNWTPNTVPTAGSNVIIPSSLSRYPKLASNVTINNINMQDGSQLDFNGFTFSVTNAATNYTYFTGATLNNSNAATDIVLNINTGTGGYYAVFYNTIVNDNITFNLTGSNIFYEANVGSTANTYNGNTTFACDIPNTLSISNGSASSFNGNLTINRTMAGTTTLFGAGATITGNFAYTNNTAGVSSLGNSGIKTSIGGTVNIAANYTTSNTFTIYRLINQTTGGIINIQNTTGFDLRNDTLKVGSLSVTGYMTGAYAYLLNNSIAGNVTIADDAGYSGGYYTVIYNNVITGNSSFTNNGTNTLYESDIAASANTYNGNTTFKATNSGALSVSNGSASSFKGNLIVSRTAAGNTAFFNAGSTITGNFAYTNNTSGVSSFGNAAIKTSIAGTINVTANYTANNTFAISHLVNQTAGGTIAIQNTTGFTIQNDTLKVVSLSVTAYKTGAYSYLTSNSINGNVTIADDPTYTGGYYTVIYSNVITGSSSFTNNGTNALYDADVANTANTYNGNTTFTATNSGALSVSNGSSSIYNGNVTVSRTAAGSTTLFNAGTTITGNFAYTNNTSGVSYLGNVANKTSITGTVNIAAKYATANFFHIYRLINQTAGGSINIQNTTAFDIQSDTLKVNSFSVTGYVTGAYALFYYNSIAGNVTIADDVSYGGGYYTAIYGNIITGNSSFTDNGTNPLYDADVANTANTYNGNVIFTATNSGTLSISNGSRSIYNGNLTVTRTAGGNTALFNAGANITGNFAYTNNNSGVSNLGNPGIKTSIGGTVDITANYTTNSTFSISYLVNQTTGGTVAIQNTTGFTIQNDTLMLSSLSVTGYKTGAYSYLTSNSITGDVTIADDATYGGGYNTVIYSNVITGNSSFTNNGTNILYDANVGNSGNKYIGNVTYIKNGGPITVAAGSIDEITQNLTLNSAGGITLGKIKFNGATDGVVDQLSTQPVSISELTMEKTGIGKVTLNKQVTVTSTSTFNGGIINTSLAKEIIFDNGVTVSNAFDSSYVSGPAIKTGNQAFTFPLGAVYKLAQLSITAPTAATDQFTAQYYFINPSPTYDTSKHAGTLNHINGNEYWTLDRTTGASNVSATLSWDTLRTGTVDALPDLRIAEWTGTTWADKGGTAITGTTLKGTLQTTAALTTYGPLTLASSTKNNPFALTLTWVGLYSTSWNTATNWNINKVPGLGNNVYLKNAATPFQPKLFSNVAINTISLTAGRLDLGNLTLNCSGTATLQGDSLIAGTLIANDIADVKNMKMVGKIVLQKTSATTNDNWFGNNKVTNDSLNIIWAGGILNMENNAVDSVLTSLKINANAGTVNLGTVAALSTGNLSVNAAGAANITMGVGANTFVSGNLDINNSGTGAVTQNTARQLVFNGIDTATYSSTGLAPVIHNITLNKIGGVQLNSPLALQNTLTFTRGIIKSDITNLLKLAAGSTVSGASDSSYVDGAVSKTGNTAFIFPVGQISKYAPISITAPSSASDVFRALYTHTNPNASGYNTAVHDPSLYYVSPVEYWLLDRINGASNVKVTLSFDSVRSGGIASIADLRVAHWTGANWMDEGNGATTGNNLMGTVQSQNSVTSFSPFTLATSTNQNVLPVTLTDFTAKKVGSNVVLNWETRNEINLERYEIERSKDGVLFAPIGSVKAANLGLYNFADASPLGGRNYYRLVLRDKDNLGKNSPVRLVDFGRIVPITIFPNPVHDYVSIRTEVETNTLLIVTITDQAGRTIGSSSFAAMSGSVKTISTKQLPAGMYNIQVRDTDGAIYFTRQIVKQ